MNAGTGSEEALHDAEAALLAPDCPPMASIADVLDLLRYALAEQTFIEGVAEAGIEKAIAFLGRPIKPTAALDGVSAMEAPLGNLRGLAQALLALCDGLEEQHGATVATLAGDALGEVRRLEGVRGTLFSRLREPRR